MFSDTLVTAAAELLDAFRQRKLKLATAESCTGGLVAGLLTEVAGSSDVLERGFVTYSNEAKCQMLSVPLELIIEHGAVSREVAMAMAEGALAHSVADVSVAVTGVAGPGGGSALKPVGLVHLGAARRSAGPWHRELRFGPIGRTQIRLKSIEAALMLARKALDGTP